MATVLSIADRDHLVAWLDRVEREEDTAGVLGGMVRYLADLSADERAHDIAEGWPTVRRNAEVSGYINR